MLFKQVDDDDIVVNRVVFGQHFLKQCRLFEIAAGSFLNVGNVEYLRRIFCAAVLNHVLHQLVIADPIIPKTSKPRSRVHDKREEYPIFGLENLFFCEVAGIGLVDGF